LAIDAHIFLYQFLTTIRSRDGTLLTDSKGQVTSHLIGLLARTTNMMQQGILPCYVFDGKPPALKRRVLEQRAKVKHEAQRKYEEAAAVEDLEAMKKFASRTTRLSADMVQEAKDVILALGLPVVQAPSEGEAQAAHIAKRGDVWAAASQDADALLFGAPRLVRNLSVSGRKKKVGVLAYEEVKPRLIELEGCLAALGISHEQLLALSLLVGTDYNPGGIKGIGPQKALKLVKEHKDLAAVFEAAHWPDHCDMDWRDLLELFKTMPVTDDYALKWRAPDVEKLHALLVDKHDFSVERVNRAVAGLVSEHKARSQKGLGTFF
ncbi:MAG: flap endonuclease-1, partial [Nanoarchaeota archaeon]